MMMAKPCFINIRVLVVMFLVTVYINLQRWAAQLDVEVLDQKQVWM